ncbi:MAG: VTT domain-containing protein [Pseudomonadota bacterium]
MSTLKVLMVRGVQSHDVSESAPSRLLRWAGSPWLIPVLFLAQVAETTFFPYPYEAVFIALCLACRSQIWVYVLITALGSAAAGAIMYQLGAHYADALAARVGAQDLLADYMARFAERGASFVFLGGITPAPSYIINIAAGASGYSFPVFLAAFTTSRLLRFAILGSLLYIFGDDLARLWDRFPKWIRRVGLIILLAAVTYWFVSGLSE